MFKKTIISEFFTTISFRQALESLYLMSFGLFKLKRGKDKRLFEKELLSYLGLKDNKIISFYNGRSAIFYALKIIGISSNDEVIVNSYNCSVVINAVIQSGAKIVYSDIEKDSLSFDFEILKKNITKKTKVIILQHTFGKIPRDYKKIINFCKRNSILVIEDSAHSLGNKSEILGDFAIFSTGRDKVISSITGGFLLINNKKYFSKIKEIKKELKMPPTLLILKNLNYNIVGYKAYKFYNFFRLGKIIIFLSRKFGLITEILNKKEKRFKDNNFYLSFPNALAFLARKELKRLDKYTKIRLKNSRYYLENIKNNKIKILFNNLNNYNGFRFPILLNSEKEKNKLVKLAKENNIILGTSWSSINIVPIGADLKKSKYKLGSCKIAEDISKRIVTLPNHKMIKKVDLEKIIKLLNNYV